MLLRAHYKRATLEAAATRQTARAKCLDSRKGRFFYGSDNHDKAKVHDNLRPDGGRSGAAAVVVTPWRLQPDEAELKMLLHDMRLETAPSNISVTVSNLNNPGAFTPQMTLTAPAQTLAPSYLRLLYTDKFGYVYAFSWGN